MEKQNLRTQKQLQMIEYLKKNKALLKEERIGKKLLLLLEEGECFFVFIFQGQKQYPITSVRFSNIDYAEKYLDDIKQKEKVYIEMEEKRKQEQKETANNIQIGSILYTMWGFEQTNVEFYLVLERKGRKIIIQEIGKNKKYESQDSGTCTPNTDIKCGEPFEKRITNRGEIRIEDYRTAYLYDGVEKYWSSYY